ncbi:hypothetical protein LINPERPRIM_LOCUS37483 [Linum perenne]
MAQLFNLRTSQQAGVLFATPKVGSLQLLPPTLADARLCVLSFGRLFLAWSMLGGWGLGKSIFSWIPLPRSPLFRATLILMGGIAIP